MTQAPPETRKKAGIAPRSFWQENRLPLGIAICGFLLYSFLAIYRYAHLAYLDWDFAFTTQGLWNMLHGKIDSSLFGFDIFGSHAEFFNLLVLPLFAIIQHPLTYSFAVIAFFTLSSWVLFRIASDNLSDKPVATLVMLTYLLFPPNVAALTHDHTGELFAPFFILTAALFFERKKTGPFFLMIFFLFLIKENMPLIVIMFGFWGLFAKDRNRFIWGILPIILSLSYLLLAVKIIVPHFRGTAQYALWVRYSHIGKTPAEIAFNLLNPAMLQKALFTHANMTFIIMLFGGLLVPALLSASALTLAMPILFYHLFSDSPQEKSIFYHYALAMTPAIFLAYVRTLSKLSSSRSRQIFFSLVILAASLFQLYTLRTTLSLKLGMHPDPYLAQKWRLVRSIPQGAPIVSTFEFLPALSMRSQLYSFHKVYSREYQDPGYMATSDFNIGKRFVLPDDVEYALVDFQDPWLIKFMEMDPEYTGGKVSDFLEGWAEVDVAGPVKLYQRNRPP